MVSIIKQGNETYIKYDSQLYWQVYISSFFLLTMILILIANTYLLIKNKNSINFLYLYIFSLCMYTLFRLTTSFRFPKKIIIFYKDYLKIDKRNFLYKDIEDMFIKKIRRGRGESEYIIVLKIKGKEKMIVEYGFYWELKKIVEVYENYERLYIKK